MPRRQGQEGAQPSRKRRYRQKKDSCERFRAFKERRTAWKKVKGIGFSLNEKFAYLDSLKNLLTVASLNADESLARRFTNAGKIKVFIASGVFTQELGCARRPPHRRRRAESGQDRVGHLYDRGGDREGDSLLGI